MRTRTRLAAVLIGGGMVSATLGLSGIASADPSGSPTFRQLSGVGSDTTQDVMNAMANAVTIGGTKVLGSYDAVGSATIQTKATGCTINRPNGSGAGRTALLNSLNANSGAGDGCLDFSRSSSLDTTASTPGLTYIPFAVDSVTYAVTNLSSIPRSLTLADLQAYYHCDPSYVGASAPYDVTPMLPQAGSGTRKYWIGQMGITEAQISAGAYPCLINGVKNGQTFEEHTGILIDDKSIAPFSIAQYNAQATQTISDRRGRAVLGTIGGTVPNLMNGNFTLKRDVYNVIPTSKLTVSPWSDVFVGNSSLICQQTAVIQKYGFALSPICGDTANHS